MREQLREVLGAYEPGTLDQPSKADAAVLFLLYEHRAEPHLVFQKRSEFVLHHKGQISLPGGAADPGDPDLRFTALRETHEEMGVHPDDVDVLGRLDDIRTITGFRVTPFVGWLERYPEWKYPVEEVAYLLEVSVSHLLDPANFVEDRREVDGQVHTFPAFRFDEDLIWGATARMLTNFLDIWNAVAEFRRSPQA